MKAGGKVGQFSEYSSSQIEIEMLIVHPGEVQETAQCESGAQVEVLGRIHFVEYSETRG